MQIIRPDINLDFVGKRNLAFMISGTLMLMGLVSLVVNGGPTYGIDFAGGTLVQIKFSETTDAAKSRTVSRPWTSGRWSCSVSVMTATSSWYVCRKRQGQGSCRADFRQPQRGLR